MIPADVVSRLQLTADAAVTRVPATQQVSDALSDLAPGQRVLAEIQTLLPNGAYRALINQRDVTLALPFSAKAGDSLELEVVDNDGKLALAVVSRRAAQGESTAGAERPAVETTLSRTGNFIAGLLAKGDQEAPTKPTQLNANQPIASAPPARGADLVPLLKQAITQSGMFYESHQSQWLANRLPTDALLAQPQGRLSPVLQESATAPQTVVAANQARASERAVATATVETGQNATAAPAAQASEQIASRSAMPAAHLVAPDLVPIVQQQLEALASQTYVWQGQAWPGQPMQWEIIEENEGRKDQQGDAGQPPWQTRLTLTMPHLGEVRAALRILNGELTLSLSAQSGEAAIQLANGGDTLRSQMEAVGLKLNGFTVGQNERPAE